MSAGSSMRRARCERRPTTGFTKNGGPNGGRPSSSANRGVAAGIDARSSARAVGLNWQAMSARGLGPGRPLRSAISDASSAERSFVPNTPSAGIASHSSMKPSGSKTSTASRSAPA